MDEFDFIELLRPLAGKGALELRDDAALLDVSPDKELVLSKDTMVEGVHFPKGRIGGGFSERLLRTALSDLAAKGARPIGYMLSVAWPKDGDPKWMGGFVKGLSDAQAAFDCPLLGGDTTSTDGPLVASVTVFGDVPKDGAVLRSGARAGDDVWFTGHLGLAKKGLALQMGEVLDLSPDELLACEEAYLRPKPRFLYRKTLRAYASAAADISDGLVSEAGHIARASGVALHIDAKHVKAGSFGDDYELLFTASPDHKDALLKGAAKVNLPLTLCGAVKVGEGVWVGENPANPKGYRHKFKS